MRLPARLVRYLRERLLAPAQPEELARDAGPGLVMYTALSFLARFRGVHALGELTPGEALHFPKCNSVQGFGMKTALDVVFLDRHGVVIECGHLPPGSVRRCRRAASVLELAEGQIDALGIVAGEALAPAPAGEGAHPEPGECRRSGIEARVRALDRWIDPGGTTRSRLAMRRRY
ncbi:MAG: hypothetical protein CSB44_05145 [Gammaproteobacteria bacterium]|nr:MAG: hypothetical protein CSB44_05145 [Gammaproteobacteria bacterium]